jgi:hypothetical protein
VRRERLEDVGSFFFLYGDSGELKREGRLPIGFGFGFSFFFSEMKRM